MALYPFWGCNWGPHFINLHAVFGKQEYLFCLLMVFISSTTTVSPVRDHQALSNWKQEYDTYICIFAYNAIFYIEVSFLSFRQNKVIKIESIFSVKKHKDDGS